MLAGMRAIARETGIDHVVAGVLLGNCVFNGSELELTLDEMSDFLLENSWEIG